jgi:hypothetical protein
MVAKTYILSQAIYFMNILELNDDIRERMNNTIIGFICRGQREIAREKRYLPATRGGYNIADIGKIDMCIKAAWIIKWAKAPDIRDYANSRILENNVGNLEKISWGEISQRTFRGSWPIIKGWMGYKGEFYKTGRNILGAKLFYNTGLGERGGNVENEIFDRARRIQLGDNLGNIKVKDLLMENDLIRDKTGMENKIGFLLTMAEFFRLRLVVNRILGTYIKGPGVVRKIREIQVGKQVGGGNLRKYITVQYKLNDCTQVGVIKKVPQENIEIRDAKLLGGILALWTENVLPAELKTFAFTYTQGRLLLNRALEIIDPANNEGGCTFCRLKGEERIEPEKHDHFFWECGEMLKVKRLIVEKTGGENINRYDFWIGKNFGGLRKNKVWGMIMMKIKWYMNEKRKQRKLLNVEEINWEIGELKEKLEKSKYKGILEKIWDI